MRKWIWSEFNIYLPKENEVLIKNNSTNAIAFVEQSDLLLKPVPKQNELINEGIIVEEGVDEFEKYRKKFIELINEDTKLFVLNFVPTLECQLNCAYCFEPKGSMRTMDNITLNKSIEWLSYYLKCNPDIKQLKLQIFGGEPFFAKKIVLDAIRKIYQLSTFYKIEFWLEIVTNGVLLDYNTASILSRYNWKRIQITLDGPQKIHDIRRKSKNNKPTFQKIINNIWMLINNNFAETINLRISLDEQTADFLPELVNYLTNFGIQEKIKISIGIIAPISSEKEKIIGIKVGEIWRVIKKAGFQIPDEFIIGPWCSAMARHSAAIQPDGSLQKCYCMSGQKKYAFGQIFKMPANTHDNQFQQFLSRTNKCVQEKCPWLPLCGGNCIHDGVIYYGKNFNERLCQKELIKTINMNLLNLNYIEN